MQNNAVLDLSQYQKTEKGRSNVNPRRPGNKGRVYSRNGKLWVDFRYLGERVRESAGLSDTALNRKEVRGQLNLITAEIENGLFKFAERFPHSKKRRYFTEREGQTFGVGPEDVFFKEYLERWWEDMKPGMSESQVRDYTTILTYHLVPYFGEMTFSEISPVRMKKFVAHMKGKKNCQGKLLSGKRIQNVMIPMRVIVRDAISEYEWNDFSDPFIRLKLPKARKLRIYPFNLDEWKQLMAHMLEWYRPYFEFAVQTGLRPSEQVALKWIDIDSEYIHVERSRVRNREKDDMKTFGSQRMIELRPLMKKALDSQRELTGAFQSDYVFINTEGRPILQDKLREVWARVMTKSGLKYRRMYETRHTFASWALGAGELPEWVARTLGHVNTSMVYKTYGRYIRNLTRQDGSAFEKLYAEATNAQSRTNCAKAGHNCGHNGSEMGLR